MYFYPLGGCLSCNFRKTGYYSQPLITSKSAGPEVDVLSGFHCIEYSVTRHFTSAGVGK